MKTYIGILVLSFLSILVKPAWDLIFPKGKVEVAVSYLAFPTQVCYTTTHESDDIPFRLTEMFMGEIVNWEKAPKHNIFTSKDSVFIWREACFSKEIKLSKKEFDWMFTVLE